MGKLKFLDKWHNNGINRHTTRKYFINGVYVYIDKTHNGLGGFYQLTKEVNSYGFHPTIKVNGKDYFGDGWRWERVEKFVEKYLNGESHDRQ